MMIFAIGASFFAGIISSFFGIGGGIVFVPLMVVGMGMAMKKLSYFSNDTAICIIFWGNCS